MSGKRDRTAVVTGQEGATRLDLVLLGMNFLCYFSTQFVDLFAQVDKVG
ncbi:MAG: hypothetical protein J7641_20410 [Cyanobacteria bacterium SID2]|nr:hypothetical protein [Cyanobacteria bacterium SID2]MBP0003524.1 hypothetical protein [Cyanobacteria bacterium SBC]